MNNDMQISSMETNSCEFGGGMQTNKDFKNEDDEAVAVGPQLSITTAALGACGGYVRLFTAVIIFLTAIVSNIDRIASVAQAYLQPQRDLLHQFEGEWIGVFREFDESGNNQVVRSEVVKISANFSSLFGSLTTSEGESRVREFSANFAHDVFILQYLVEDKGRAGGCAYVLRGTPEENVLRGFWMGNDPEKNNKLVVAPYVLARHKQTETIKKDNEEWLAQKVYMENS